jgi:hypothetical protein
MVLSADFRQLGLELKHMPATRVVNATIDTLFWDWVALKFSTWDWGGIGIYIGFQL